MTLGEFLLTAMHNPMLLAAVVLTMGVVFVNGWTDAPNAIAACVATRSLPPRAAVAMSAVCNFLGVLLMTWWSGAVTESIMGLADFGSGRTAAAALCAAMTAIILWAVAAWRLGVPTSESHALIAGLTGAAVALHGGTSGIHADQWWKVLWGLVLSVALGFVGGILTARLTETLCRDRGRRRADRYFRRAEIAGGAALSFLHGAQDGQKFLGVLLLGAALSGSGVTGRPPVWMMALCSAVMALGTSLGGYRILKAVGMDMVHLEPYQGVSADAAGAGCLLIATLLGLPVSTTHAKTAAILGVGASRRWSAVDLAVVRDMALTWMLTFPGCGLIGFFTARVFLGLL